MSRQILISFKSDYIVEHAIRNGISFAGKGLTDIGEIGGDIKPPILGVEAFLELLKRKHDLFAQTEYADFYLKILEDRYNDDWIKALSGGQHKHNIEGLPVDQYLDKRKRAFWFRAKRNFYVSMIDTLHAWALLQESKWYDICYIDSQLDALAKTDLTLVRNGETVKIALYGPKKGEIHRAYKETYRTGYGKNPDIYKFGMPFSRRKIANKRWYELSDFLPIKPEDVEFETTIQNSKGEI